MKRAALPFDTRYFEKLTKRGKNLSIEERFHNIYYSNHWAGSKTVSGQGSDEEQTREISIQIPALARMLDIRVLLDIPCGDFHWFGKMDIDLERYVGGDIIDALIEQNKAKYAAPNRSFIRADLLNDPLPEADMILCRDCLVHFSFADIERAIDNIRKSGSTYLLTTTFPECDENIDITTGDWRIINLEKPPFSFPVPIKIINEKCSEGHGTYADKSLGLWKISDL